MRRGFQVRVVGPQHWIFIPALLALAATVILATPVRLFRLPLPEPVIPMVLAFTWPLIRPSVLAPLVLALCGLFLDLLWGGPLGLWALMLLGVYGVVLMARSFIVGQETIVMSFWYAGLTVGAWTVACLLMFLRTGTMPNLLGGAVQVIVTLALFPIAAWLLERFDDGDVRFR